jgi:DNA adenine methylase
MLRQQANMKSQAIAPIKPAPFVKWVGGKKKLLNQLLPLFPEFKNYYEPFAGGGAVFFGLQPANAILGDCNEDLIEAYKCVRDFPENLILRLKTHQQAHSPKHYYQVREIYRDGKQSALMGIVDWAAIFIYLNKTCFNGLYRKNKQGQFNTPIGRYSNPGICQPEIIHAASQALQSVTLKTGDFSAIASLATSPDDFVYFDPPYYPLNATSNFTSYTQDGFSLADQVRLRDLCLELRSRGVKIAVSNSDCQTIRELYQDFNLHQIWAARSINSKAGDRGKISELLITSY